MTTIIILSIFTAIILTAALLLQTGAYYLVERPTDKAIAEATTDKAIAEATTHMESHTANRRTLKRNADNRRTRQAGFTHRVDRRLRKGTRCTSQPTQTKSQGHWHVPEAPKGAPSNQGINPLASRFNSAVNNLKARRLKARRRALKRLAGELMEFDPEYIFT